MVAIFTGLARFAIMQWLAGSKLPGPEHGWRLCHVLFDLVLLMRPSVEADEPGMAKMGQAMH